MIVVGDTLTGGGTVVSGSSFTDIEGQPVARIGDRALCLSCGTTVSIVSGDPSLVIDGSPAAREGDYVSCGHRLG